MKTRSLILIAAVALLATSCRYVHQIKDMVEDMVNLPVTSENVANRAETLGSDVALLSTVADTQYVLFRQNREVFKKEHAYRCYAMRYVPTGDNSWRARVVQSKLDEPEQPVVAIRTADNALTLTVDSLVIAVTDIAVTDTVLTFRYGFDEPDRSATLYLYGKARKMKDPLSETSIQQMLSLSLVMDYLLENGEDEIDAIDVPAAPEIPEIPDMELDTCIGALTYAECYARYSRMDSLALALGFRDREVNATNDHIKLEVKGVSRNAKKCHAVMEQMGKAAATSGCRRWEVAHKPHHRNCKFTIEWKW